MKNLTNQWHFVAKQRKLASEELRDFLDRTSGLPAGDKPVAVKKKIIELRQLITQYGKKLNEISRQKGNASAGKSASLVGGM